MTRIALLGVFAFAALGGTARAADALAPDVSQCISANAPKVEAAIADLNQAVDFLVTDVCAEPLAAQQARESRRTSEQQTARWKKMCDDSQADAKKDPSNADAAKGYEAWCGTLKYGFLTTPNDDEDESGYTIFSALTPRSPAAVALASRLLLDLRLSHAGKQP